MQAIPTLRTAPPQTAERAKKNSPLTNNKRWMRFRGQLVAKRKLMAARVNRSICGGPGSPPFSGNTCCGEGKPYEPMTPDAHHIKPKDAYPELCFEASNLVLLCKRHHRQAENAAGT